MRQILPTLLLVAAASSLHADELLWSDEFDGTSLDTSKWEAMLGDGSFYGIPGWGNNELQYYQSDSDNLFVSGGLLHIVARQQSAGGYNYTSARIRTRNKADFLYGRLEARIQIPSGQGLWPAFWMLPTNSPYGGWAAGGEIDIMESVNTATSAHGTIHFGDNWPGNVSNGGSLYPGGVITGFHVYAIEWDPLQIRWYFDGQLFHTVNENQWFSTGASGDAEAPFDVPFHFLLNVAVGGNWPGPPNGSTPFPAEMLVDWVRVYVDELQAPYGGSATILPGTVEAEDFDLGGAGQAFWDADASNNGNQYRTDQGVDIEACSEGGFNVGWIREGEWLEYTVTGQVGEYNVVARVASESAGGTFRIEVDGVDATGPITVPVTGGWQTWTDVSATLELPSAGTHVLRFVNTTPLGEYNFNRLDFTFVPPLMGDANGDGQVDFLDLNLVLTFWGTNDPRADLNGNGLVEFDDLNIVLGNWGAVDN